MRNVKSVIPGIPFDEALPVRVKWYIFSALGFYPVCPGSEEYALGSPKVVSAEVDLGNGKILSIKIENQHRENVFVREVWLNERRIEGYTLNHHDLAKGGTLKFVMSNR
jgi:putative alpha-1,2-mannosidase